MLLTLGLDSQFGTVEAVLAIMDDLGIKIVSNEKYTQTARTVTFCTVSFTVGLVFCTNSGLYYFQLFDAYSAALPLLFICLCELVAVAWIYGVDKFIHHIEDMTGRVISRWWWWMWKWVTPMVILVILVWSFVTAITDEAVYSTPTGFKAFPSHYVFLGWCLILSSTLFIPGAFAPAANCRTCLQWFFGGGFGCGPTRNYSMPRDKGPVPISRSLSASADVTRCNRLTHAALTL